ncbi:hypothetical protein [Sinorhizobium meliloti]|uniref:hypothetical protein n=1 Tax=Rhizobium meliloti TaxID=382 RepID=UPI000FD3B8F4|nr:hypothetical protein [Sinorhizobium meliloti]MDW9633601.1 hypothetical protein [Sinorhizobium meliloti]RVJ90025.1 hypothetical protein CN173_24390 [Sinorhizobium meliloti]
MAIADLVHEIETLKRPNRETDVKIALAVGWQRKVEHSGKDDGSRNVIWYWQGEAASRLPNFTGSIDASLQLLDMVSPRFAGGFSWLVKEHQKTATAKVNDEPFSHAETPALALCLAALKIKQTQLNEG